ncbi:MAG: hypothetical protein M1826_004759 [Phylliscum demangeonii]|nr:MAG: hypothetical protein M1826_004759 [Phylliscum demangeonii]
MAGMSSDAPAVSMSFANNFWGKEDAGVHPLLERMHNAKVTSDEIRTFYNGKSSRAAIEDEYARKLLNLCRKPLGSSESGTLRVSLDTVRGELESMGKAHQTIATQMKSELEEPLAAHAGGMKERRKIVQLGIEKLLKLKIQQTLAVNKSRDRYEQDCLRIKGYLAQGHMVMGQEERKNKAKLEKTQIHLATSNNEYEHAVKALEETTVRWNREWKAACDKFQDLEEERLDFMKSSLWAFANIASTVCVSDDASCEKVRLSLEECDVEKDIGTFIRDKGTGQEIPDAPKYINFCRGDVNDTQSEISDEDGYSVAQFQRTINPAFRTSSPQPSIYESHHDPQSALAAQMLHHHPPPSQPAYTPSSRENTLTPQNFAQQPNGASGPNDVQSSQAAALQMQQMQLDDLPRVPYNEYPTEGMTMYCRTAPPSERSSATSPARPSSGGSHSEYSNPTSFSSHDPSSGTQSPTKSGPLPGGSSVAADGNVQKKKSNFFQNHSPFRRKSKHESDDRGVDPSNVTPTPTRNTWSAKTTARMGGAGEQPPSSTKRMPMFPPDSRRTDSPEPVDPRANFQLNVGNNIFDVATPNSRSKAGSPQRLNGAAAAMEELDPIAQALAELKGVGKQASVRMSADRYHGIQTPAPPSSTASSSMPAPTPWTGVPSSAMRGTPPPSYDQPPMKRLDLPQPAFTSAQMQRTRQKYLDQRQSMFGDSPPSAPPAASRSGHPQPREPLPRALSPAPLRAVSPRPGAGHEAYADQRQDYRRSMSPNPPTQTHAQHRAGGRGPTQSLSPRKRDPADGYSSGGRGDGRGRGGVDDQVQMQLSSAPADESRDFSRGRHPYANRPVSYYGSGGGSSGGGHASSPSLSSAAMPPGSQQPPPPRSQHPTEPQTRVRSRSVATPGQLGQQFTNEGRLILHHARALYVYQAAIPEELSFAKGDVLAVLRHQDDGWWEAEVAGKRGRPGLVPSNYLQRC